MSEERSGDPSAAPRACSECVRRKGRCDKRSPCSKCISRGVPHLCRVEVLKPPAALPIPPDADREALHAMALAELLHLKQNAIDTTARISRLEALFAKAVSAAPQFDKYEAQTALAVTSSSVLLDSSTFAAASLDGHYHNTPQTPAESSENSIPEVLFTPIATDLEVDATQALEYMALGRQQDLPSIENNSQSPSSTFILPSPITLFPNLSSIAAAVPSRTRSDILITYCLTSLSWHLSVLHAPTFMEEYTLFWAKEEAAFASTHPAWLALYFSLLTVGAALSTMEQQILLGCDQEQCVELSRKWAPCATACLYRSDFLERHSLYSLLTICILAHGGRDIWSTNLIASLRCAGLSIAMETNLHRMVSNDAWDSSMLHQPPDIRTKGLINRETCKRVFWSLCREDWYSINWRKTFTLRPSQISTPLPLNAHDHDLSAGRAIDRPTSSYTVVSWSLMKIQLARFVQAAFQSPDPKRTEEDQYAVVLEVDTVFETFLNELPEWWTDGRLPVRDMPSTYKWLRSAFVIASQHKLLALHRPFMNRPEARYQPSKTRGLGAARAILREAPLVDSCRFWTVLYQMSVASFIALRELFTAPPSTSSTPTASFALAIAEQRREITKSLLVLEAASPYSGIARRGSALIRRLLDDEEHARLAAAPSIGHPWQEGRGNAEAEVFGGLWTTGDGMFEGGLWIEGAELSTAPGGYFGEDLMGMHVG